MEWVVMVGITESQVPVDWARSRMRGSGKFGGGLAMLASRAAFRAAYKIKTRVLVASYCSSYSSSIIV